MERYIKYCMFDRTLIHLNSGCRNDDTPTLQQATPNPARVIPRTLINVCSTYQYRTNDNRSLNG
jgi:hypothetical protein